MKRAASLGLLAVISCGGGSSSPPTTPPSTNPFRITISSAGASPKEVTVPPGTRVLFINNDTRRRNMTSDPHPEHNDCDELNAVGNLNPGQSKETGNLNTVRTCGFHDHDDPDNNAVKGHVVIRP
jgi:plastocyanin